MSINIKDQEAWVLSRIAYMDLKSTATEVLKKYKGKTLKEIATELYVPVNSTTNKPIGPLNNFGEWGALSNTEQNEMLGDIIKGKYPHLSNLVLQDFTNQNDSNGLVAYAFCDKNNPQNKIFAFRGTEGSQLTASGLRSTIGFVLKDYIDNYYTGTKRVSLQFDPAKDFVDKNMVDGTEIFVTGHSKGGGIASYIASTRAGVQGKAFDGPGVGQCLTLAQKATLSNNTSFVNYVHQYDRVGALAFHPEARIYSKEKLGKDPGFATAHMMQSIQFDSNGNIIPGDRSTLSKGWELVTKSIVFGNDISLVHPLGVLNDILNP